MFDMKDYSEVVIVVTKINVECKRGWLSYGERKT